MNKILFISTNDWIPWGGSEELWSQCANYISTKYSGEIYVYASVMEWNPVPFKIQNLLNTGVAVIYKIKNHQLPFYKRVINKFIPANIKFVSNLNFHSPALTLKPDLVIFSLGGHNESENIDITYCKTENIPYMLIVQLASEANVKPDGKSYNTIRDNYLSAERVFFVSNQNKAIVEEVIANKILSSEIISNPHPKLTNFDLPYPKTDKTFQLAFVASLSSNHKGHDTLFKVLSLPKWRDRNLEINLYGSGPHKEYLQELKKYFNLTSIIFQGQYESLDKLWAKNHGFILCSRMEGQSLALLEALTYNRMCIVTKVGDAENLIEDNVTGFLSETTTPNLIDDVLERAWNRRFEWETIGKLAGEKYRQLNREDPIVSFSEKVVSLCSQLKKN